MRMDRDHISEVLWTLLAAGLVAVVGIHMVDRFELAYPKLLWTLALPVVLALMHLLRARKRTPRIPLPTLTALSSGPLDPRALLRPLPRALGLAGIAVLVLAMARPQSRDSWQDVQREGIDIIIALDVSVSMLAKDLRPDRLQASKRVGIEFIEGRPNDRIGLVVYEGEAFTQCPLTTDHRVLKDLMNSTRSGLLDGGTAVGMGLATALSRLRESEAKSKVVILLTDGVNNVGTVQPADAAQIAEGLGIRVYTIGVGTRGKALMPVTRYANGQFRYDYVDVDLDEPMLKQVAATTGGQYFRATDERKLREIYQEIDRLEKTRMKVTEYSQRHDEYYPYAVLGGGLLLLGLVLDKSLLRSMA
jgi:Ca-activated chloride channel family protein